MESKNESNFQKFCKELQMLMISNKTWNVIYGEIVHFNLNSKKSLVRLETEEVVLIDRAFFITDYELKTGDYLKMEICGANGEIRNVDVEEECSFVGVIATKDKKWMVNNTILDGKLKSSFKVGQYINGLSIKTTNTQFPYRAITATLLNPELISELYPKNLKKRFYTMKAAFGQVFDKSVITIFISPGLEKRSTITLFNNSNNYRNMKRVEIMSTFPGSSPVSTVLKEKKGKIKPLSNFNVQISSNPLEFPSIFNEILIIHFKRYRIAIILQIIAGSNKFCAQFQSQPESNELDSNPNLLYKTQLTKNSEKVDKIKVDEFEIPKLILPLIKLDEKVWLKYIQENFPEVWKPRTDLDSYRNRWQNLLHICELYENKMIRKNFNQSQVVLKYLPSVRLWSLSIPCASDKKPSILPGSIVVIQLRNILNPIVCYGILSAVCRNHVLLDIEQKFRKISTQKVDVNFILSNLNFRIQHEVLRNIRPPFYNRMINPVVEKHRPTLVDVQFDKNQKLVILSETEPKKLEMINQALNISQLSAIRHVLRGEHRPAPYIISGPPGTGKTTTIVEIIGQIISNLPNANLLICTQSNSAANLILRRLIETNNIDDDIIIRMISPRLVQENSIPDELKEYCGVIDKYSKTKFVEKIGGSFISLLKARILIITCGSVGYLTKIGLPKDHFSHLILDEAGQCFETETIVPMSLLDPDNGQVIMAGDEQQLGPVVQSEVLKQCRYDLSLFERLLQTPLYDRGHPDCDHTISNLLVYNYRSVPSVLKLYNDLFYNGRLKCMVDEAKYSMAKYIEHITPPNASRSEFQSVFFYDVLGIDSQRESNPSWMNLREAEVVQYLYRTLIKLGLESEDIGIVSPYQGQVQLLKSILQNADIGSAAEFQGQERKIIILSTVRSNIDMQNDKPKYTMGFLRDKKLTNVALSRAQYLLLIVGNASLLSKDSMWKNIIEYTCTRFAYIDVEKRFLKIFS